MEYKGCELANRLPNKSDEFESKYPNDIIDIQWEHTNQKPTQHDIDEYKRMFKSTKLGQFGFYTMQAVAVQAGGLFLTASVGIPLTVVHPILGVIVGGSIFVTTHIAAGITQLVTRDTKYRDIKKDYNASVSQYNNKVKAFQNTTKKLIKLTEKCILEEDKFKSFDFAYERWNINRKVVLMIGPTGYGKSTVCNRLIGNKDDTYDISKSESCPFNVAKPGNIFAETAKINKVTKKIILNKKGNKNKLEYELSAIDTPGAFGTYENDECFNENDECFNKTMKKNFNACGGINAFFIFFKFLQKWDKNYDKLLRFYQKFWGKKMWNYCHIIITNCDKDSKTARKMLADGLPNTKKNIKAYLNKISGNLCNNVKMYEFGDENFTKSTQNLLLMLKDSNQKYICDNIRCKINNLWDDQQKQMQICWNKLNEIQEMKNQLDKRRIYIEGLK